MLTLSNSVAIALPADEERESIGLALQQARLGHREIELRIGVGQLRGHLPVRVLGHAYCLYDAMQRDIPKILGTVPIRRVIIFSSSGKVREPDRCMVLQTLVSLAGGLWLLGVKIETVLDLSSAEREVPEFLWPNLPEQLRVWFERAAERSGNNADAACYAAEHAAPSMFGDLATSSPSPLRITVGGAPEAKFWAVRARVRTTARAAGMTVAPAFGVILKSLRVPWYHNTNNEPALADMKKWPAAAIAGLESAANPALRGNIGLVREARAARRFLSHPGLSAFINAIENEKSAWKFAAECGFLLGERLKDAVGLQ